MLIGWNKCFHIVCPIVPIDSNEGPIQYYMEWMTKVNGFPMVPVEEILARKTKAWLLVHGMTIYIVCSASIPMGF